MDVLDLSGRWRAAPADEELRRIYPDPAFDDAAWTELAVPGHWRAAPGLEDHDGPVLYRHRFEAPDASEAGRRWWLRLDGVFYQSDVWLDGAYVGDTEGYFAPHAFEVTAALRGRREHTLAVEVACPRTPAGAPRRALLGAFDGWHLDADWNPGGLWRPVVIEQTGPVRITRLRVVCTEATAESATLLLDAEVDALDPVEAELRTTVPGVEGSAVQVIEAHQLAARQNRLAWQVVVERPALWWPHALGDQPMHDVVVEIGVDGHPSDARRLRTGLRQVRLDNWVMTVNGERLFLKGSSYAPTRPGLADATVADTEDDVALARRAGLDLLRVHAHVARPDLYDAADAQGLLLWQDLPLHGTYARGVRRQAVRQARQAVDLLGHHPSIALWCGHDEPVGHADLVRQQLPSWNKTVLDASIHRALVRADPSRPAVAHSGVAPHAGSGGTDSHLTFGWDRDDRRELARLAARFPRLVRFVSRFGAQAVPADADFADAGRWPDLDWDRLERHYGMERAAFDRHVPPAAFASFEDWQRASQDHQVLVVRRQVETLRRLKYRPTGGFCHFLLADAQPAISHAVLDHRRVPKPGYEALASACAPVIVVADEPPDACRPGAELDLAVHVVNDLRTALEGAIVTAALSWPGGSRTWRWEGDVGPDSCVRVGAVAAAVGEHAGPVDLHLSLSHPATKAANHYTTVVAPG